MTEYLYDAEPCKCIEEADDIIDFYIHPQVDGQHRWILVLKSNGEKIGTCGFHCWNSENQTVEVGYDLQKEYWGQGLMREALTAIINSAINEMKATRIDAHIYPENHNSSGLAQRLGFTESPETTIYTFRNVDYLHHIYSLYLDKKES